jgi:hypothetical protein
MGALSNSGRKTANFAGFYKGIQSAGAAIIWRIDATEKPFMIEFATTWAILAGALICAAPVILLKIKDATPIEEDIQFTDLNYADIVPKSAYLGQDRHSLDNRTASLEHRSPVSMDKDIELSSMQRGSHSEEV